MAKEEYDKSSSTYEHSKKLAFALIFLGILMGNGFGIMVARSITGPVVQAATHVKTMAGGDLSTHLHINHKETTQNKLNKIALGFGLDLVGTIEQNRRHNCVMSRIL